MKPPLRRSAGVPGPLRDQAGASRPAALLAAWLLVLAPALALGALGKPAESTSPGPAPAPHLGPVEVLRLQLAALRDNGLLDEGISLAFRFASPANRRVTGPLERFAAMVRSPPYAPLLNHREARIDLLAEEETEVAYRVRVIGPDAARHVYLWVLSRQAGEECRGCWMTDVVVAAEQASPTGI